MHCPRNSLTAALGLVVVSYLICAELLKQVAIKHGSRRQHHRRAA